ncbi:unnamed protein product [marine sediment metagenome]|uniref:Uncharacterized protein n=1 Tax=marine sediment metagenome TaxID=412755 RepID=X1B6W7_9ZZZZ
MSVVMRVRAARVYGKTVQKYITIPKDSGIEVGEYVMISKMEEGAKDGQNEINQGN